MFTRKRLSRQCSARRQRTQRTMHRTCALRHNNCGRWHAWRAIQCLSHGSPIPDNRLTLGAPCDVRHRPAALRWFLPLSTPPTATIICYYGTIDRPLAPLDGLSLLPVIEAPSSRRKKKRMGVCLWAANDREAGDRERGIAIRFTRGRQRTQCAHVRLREVPLRGRQNDQNETKRPR